MRPVAGGYRLKSLCSSHRRALRGAKARPAGLAGFSATRGKVRPRGGATARPQARNGGGNGRQLFFISFQIFKIAFLKSHSVALLRRSQARFLKEKTALLSARFARSHAFKNANAFISLALKNLFWKKKQACVFCKRQKTQRCFFL